MSNMSLNELKGISNPAELLPKRPPVEEKDAMTEALGDLGVVLKRENEETEQLAKAMIEDMKLKKALGEKIEFRNDPYATEGLQPITKPIDTTQPGIDSQIDDINVKPSEALTDVNYTSITNIITPPTYVNVSTDGQRITGVYNIESGPRSVLKDEGVMVHVDTPNHEEELNGGEKDVDLDNMSDEQLAILLGINVEQNKSEKSDVIMETPIQPTVQEHSIQQSPVQEPKYEVPEYIENPLPEPEFETQWVGGDISDDILEQSDMDTTEDILDFDEQEQEKMLSIIKSKVKEKLGPKKFDISSYTVANPTKVVNLFSNKTKPATIGNAEWHLPATGVNIIMSKFQGTEIVALSSQDNKSVRNSNEAILKLIYDHIQNPEKPDYATFIRAVKMEDLDQLYWAIYMASYSDANYLPYYCTSPKCKEVDIIKKDFDEMIVFFDDKIKESFYSKLATKTYNFTVDAIEMERVVISDKYVVDIKLPSIYDVLIEPFYLTEQYRKAHQDNIATLTYIDTVYTIDHENHTLVPIDYTVKTDDESIIVKNKYRLFLQFLNELSSDEYTFLVSLTNKLVADKMACAFIVPEHRCEKCGTLIPAKEQSAMKLLFIRHQLASLANM